MIFGSLFVIVMLVHKIFGGFAPMFQRVAVEKPELLTIQDAPYWSSIILIGIIGSYCWMEVFNRMFVASSPRELKLSTAGAPILGASMYISLLLLGIGCGLLPEIVSDPEAGFLNISKEIGGPVLLGFVGIIILAAEVSSTDSGLVTGGIVIANTIIKRINPNLSEEQLVKYSRYAIIVEAVLAGFLAMLELPMLMTIAIFTFEFIVHVFPTAIVGVLWKRGTRTAAWAGLAVGIPVTVFLKLNPEFSAAHFSTWAPGIIGLVFNLAVYIIVSLMSKPDPYVEELFDSVKETHLKKESVMK